MARYAVYGALGLSHPNHVTGVLSLMSLYMTSPKHEYASPRLVSVSSHENRTTRELLQMELTHHRLVRPS